MSTNTDVDGNGGVDLKRGRRRPTVVGPAKIDRLPPHSVECEQGVLGSIFLLPNECIPEAKEKLPNDAFYDLRHRTIYEVLLEMYDRKEPIDNITVSQRLKDRQQLDAVGGGAFISSLPDGVPSGVNIGFYLNVVREKYILRRMIQTCTGAVGRIYEHEGEPDTVIADVEREILEVKQAAARVENAPISLGNLRPPNPENTLIGNRRWMCRGGSFAMIGPTGVGKSSLTMQMAICWALGQECFGFKPRDPLRSLIVQAENDEGDLYEMREGIYGGLELTQAQRQQVAAHVEVETIDDATGFAFINRVKKLLAVQRDICWIDNYYAYLGGSVSDQELATRFLRTWLAPVLREGKCCGAIVHHPPKPSRDDGKSERKLNEYAYAGAGSVELANWARGVAYLEPSKDDGMFRLILGKRGQRAGWTESDGVTRTCSRLIAHSNDGRIYWRDADEGEQTAAARAKRPFCKDDILPHVPVAGAVDKNALKSRCNSSGCAFGKFDGFLAELLSDGRVHEWLIKRSRTNPLHQIARTPQTLGVGNDA